MVETIGLDVGGTKIAGGVVDHLGVVKASARRKTPAGDPDALAATIFDVARELQEAATQPLAGIGVACAGMVDPSGSTVVFAPNLAWRNEPLRERIEAALELPVVIENDANAAAWGEYRFGAGAGVRDMLLVTVGTGIGGGCVSNGRLLRGAFGAAGEIGHLAMVPGGHRCGCGNRGCWETYASGSALVREARELVAAGSSRAAALRQLCGGKLEKLTGKHVTAAAIAGDEAARELLSDLGTAVGVGAASVAAVLDPGLVVIGGGGGEVGDLFLEPVREAFGRHLFGRGHRNAPAVVAATLGNNAGMIGAAAIAQEKFAG